MLSGGFGVPETDLVNEERDRGGEQNWGVGWGGGRGIPVDSGMCRNVCGN